MRLYVLICQRERQGDGLGGCLSLEELKLLYS